MDLHNEGLQAVVLWVFDHRKLKGLSCILDAEMSSELPGIHMKPKVRKFGDFIGDLFLHPDGHAWRQLMVFCICTAGTCCVNVRFFWGEFAKGRFKKAKKSCEQLVFVGVYGVYGVLLRYCYSHLGRMIHAIMQCH